MFMKGKSQISVRFVVQPSHLRPHLEFILTEFMKGRSLFSAQYVDKVPKPILRCHFKKENTKKIKNLKLQLPHISIIEKYQNLNIADPNLWENRTKPQDIFPSTLILGPPGSPDGP